MPKLLIHASGYLRSPWQNNELTEIRTAAGLVANCKWSPSTADFAAVGVGSRGSSAADSVAAMLKVIENQAVESIEELRIVGHANSDMLSLAGTIVCDNVIFDQEPALIGDSSTFKAAISKCRDVQDRFTSDAKVILMGCEGGSTKGSGSAALLGLLSHAFLRTAAGFKEEIKYTIKWGPTQPDGTIIAQGPGRTRVTGRGEMKYESFGELFGTWQTDAWKLKPDSTNNDGDIYISMRDKNPARGASDLFWRILKEFYKTPWAAADHPWVSGAAIDATVPGLRVIWRDKAETTMENGVPMTRAGGAHVDVNPDFAAKTTPKTLKNRVSEVGQALELVKQKKSGVIPAVWSITVGRNKRSAVPAFSSRSQALPGSPLHPRASASPRDPMLLGEPNHNERRQGF
jgi:hypothetical protein